MGRDDRTIALAVQKGALSLSLNLGVVLRVANG